MNIRKATLNDAGIIAELNQHVQQVHADALSEIFKPAIVTRELVDLYREWLAQSQATVFLAEDAGQAVGYIYALIMDRPETLFSYARRTLLVDQMSVNPTYYGSGVAGQLIDAVKQLAREENVTRIILDVWDFNGRAKRFYEKQGFSTFNYRMQLVLA